MTMNGTNPFLGSRKPEIRFSMNFCHATPLVLALVSHYASSIINGTTAFPKPRIGMQYKMTFGDMWHHWCCHQFHILPPASSMAPKHSSDKDDQNVVWPIFWSCDTSTTGVDVTWCQHWHHMMPTSSLSMAPLHSIVKTTEMLCNITFWSSDTTVADTSMAPAPLYSLGWDDKN